ncbi:hypothetical protein GBA65_16625 [Rubrobacter marinus]|uniref:Uncharacterized protein n=1 Tax=Rubrobacter marinus TaxID=2653852 RepID=A0A6G8Q079_9ACTN|nr:Ig-like domain-containing protein [Rubrobacter marinus]QIN79883.1 hypothetical protein GBA65_16625 [Rubrobacter marinus]
MGDVLSGRRDRALMIFGALLALMLLSARGAAAQEEPYSGCTRVGDEATVTGTMIWPEITTYMYGIYYLVDEASGTPYALEADAALDLDAYVDKRVTLTGGIVPGYEAGRVEGGPTLLDVTRIEEWPDVAAPTGCDRLPPRLGVENGSVVVREDQAARNGGTYDDAFDRDARDTPIAFSPSLGEMCDVPFARCYYRGFPYDRDEWYWRLGAGEAPPGTSTVVVAARDQGGLSSEVSFDLTVLPVPPEVSLTGAPSAGQRVNGSVELSAEARDSSGVERVEFVANGVVVGQDLEAPYALAWDTASSEDGPTTVSARAFDKWGTAAESATVAVVVDNARPEAATLDLAAESDSGASRTDDLTNDPTPKISGTAEPGSRVTLYEGATVLGTASAGASGSWSVTAAALPDAPHALHATATDEAGNVSAASGTLLVKIDTARPTATAVSPSRGARAVPAGANVTATFSEAMGPATPNGNTLTLVRRGTTAKVAATVRYDAARKRAILDPSRNLRRGATYTATLSTGVEDLAGNPLARTTTWSFTVRR